MPSAKSKLPVYTVQKLSPGDLGMLMDFADAFPSPFVDRRLESECAKALDNGMVYGIIDSKGALCSRIIAWDFHSELELGTARNKGPYGFKFMTILFTCAILDAAFDRGFKSSTVVAGIYPDNDIGKKVITGGTLNFSPIRVSAEFNRARESTKSNPTCDHKPLDYYAFFPSKENLTTVANFAASLKKTPIRINSSGDRIHLDIKPWYDRVVNSDPQDQANQRFAYAS